MLLNWAYSRDLYRHKITFRVESLIHVFVDFEWGLSKSHDDGDSLPYFETQIDIVFDHTVE